MSIIVNVKPDTRFCKVEEVFRLEKGFMRFIVEKRACDPRSLRRNIHKVLSETVTEIEKMRIDGVEVYVHEDVVNKILRKHASSRVDYIVFQCIEGLCKINDVISFLKQLVGKYAPVETHSNNKF